MKTEYRVVICIACGEGQTSRTWDRVGVQPFQGMICAHQPNGGISSGCRSYRWWICANESCIKKAAEIIPLHLKCDRSIADTWKRDEKIIVTRKCDYCGSRHHYDKLHPLIGGHSPKWIKIALSTEFNRIHDFFGDGPLDACSQKRYIKLMRVIDEVMMFRPLPPIT